MKISVSTIVLTLLLIVFFTSTAFAQCTITSQMDGTDTTWANYSTLGNTFIPSCSGSISTITVRVVAGTSVTNGTLNVYNGDYPSSSKILYTQEGINLSSSDGLITLTSSVPITAGNKYCFTIKNSAAFKLYCENYPSRHPDGIKGIKWGAVFNFYVVDFVISVVAGGGSGSDVPTLPLLGYLLLAALLIGLGVHGVRRKQRF